MITRIRYIFNYLLLYIFSFINFVFAIISNSIFFLVFIVVGKENLTFMLVAIMSVFEYIVLWIYVVAIEKIVYLRRKIKRKNIWNNKDIF